MNLELAGERNLWSVFHCFLFFRMFSYSSHIYILPVILLAVVFNISRFSELETCITLNTTRVINITLECQHNHSIPCKLSICPTKLRESLSYCRDYILIANFVIMVFIPLLILTIVHYHIYRSITISASNITRTTTRQKREQSIVRILLAIVLVFTVCNIPRAVINLYEVGSRYSHYCLSVLVFGGFDLKSYHEQS